MVSRYGPIPDKALMYASIFSYKPASERHHMLAYTIPAEKIILFQNQGKIPQESIVLL